MKTGYPLPTTRFHGLDALRVFAMSLGIVLHASHSYAFGFEYGGQWWPQDNRRSPISLYICEFIHAWRMPTFFILAGCFTHPMRERNGVKRFVINRTHRILPPLIVFGTANCSYATDNLEIDS